MNLPRWTVYPALVVLTGVLFIALPSKGDEDPYAGAAAAAREGDTPGANLPPAKHERVVVLGIDGMDPDVLLEVCDRYPDRMPNFRRLITEADGVQSLGTSIPPQSPVAWSNFITGQDPGGHGIFDFIHRDPVTRGPISSVSTPSGNEKWDLWGEWQFPSPFATGGDANRTGETFWGILAEHGVPADIWRMPANFPVEPAKGLSFPGMMTPALDSAYGECSVFTTDPLLLTETGYKKVELVREQSGSFPTRLLGPPNMFKEGDPSSSTPLTIYPDYEAGAAALEIGGSILVLQPGQWSDFVEVTFEMLPWNVAGVRPLSMVDASGVVRFYLRSLEPELVLYASPVNFNPNAPIAPVSEPESASADLAEGIGIYYTQGMAEDVNSLKKELLTDDEFMQQAELVYDERTRMMDYALDEYLEGDDGGFLFFYYSTVDLCSHMMWRHGDPAHPHHDPDIAARDSSHWSERPGSTWKDTVHDLYMRMDPVLGHLRDRVGHDTTIIVMSDHGFSPYHRKFSLNTWLLEEGYLVLKDGFDRELPKSDPAYSKVSIDRPATKLGPDGEAVMEPELDEDGEPVMEKGEPKMVPVREPAVDWSRTRAYGMGFNGLYLNKKGRELNNEDTPEDESGIVDPAEADALLREIKAKLEALVDPKTGERVVLRADIATDVYTGARVDEAPDIQVGYNYGYGNSDPSSEGRIPHAVLEDNTGGTFNGHHLMAPEVVPGLLLTNRPVRDGQHSLEDLTVEVLRQYGIEPGEGMKGHPVLE